jgi:hypothetical protein
MPEYSTAEVVDIQARIDIALLRGEFKALKNILYGIFLEGLVVIGVMVVNASHMVLVPH